MNNSFQNDRMPKPIHNNLVTETGVQPHSTFNQKMIMLTGNNVGGRIQIIENLNINSQKNAQQIFQTQQPDPSASS